MRKENNKFKFPMKNLCFHYLDVIDVFFLFIYKYDSKRLNLRQKPSPADIDIGFLHQAELSERDIDC